MMLDRFENMTKKYKLWEDC